MRVSEKSAEVIVAKKAFEREPERRTEGVSTELKEKPGEAAGNSSRTSGRHNCGVYLLGKEGESGEAAGTGEASYEWPSWSQPERKRCTRS